MHPAECAALRNAWIEKLKREAIHRAGVQLTIASAAGAKKKGGGSLGINDFLPPFAKERAKLTEKEQEARLKAWGRAAAARTKRRKQHDGK